LPRVVECREHLRHLPVCCPLACVSEANRRHCCSTTWRGIRAIDSVRAHLVCCCTMCAARLCDSVHMPWRAGGPSATIVALERRNSLERAHRAYRQRSSAGGRRQCRRRARATAPWCPSRPACAPASATGKADGVLAARSVCRSALRVGAAGARPVRAESAAE
jgi:hypothetical protein